MRRPVTNADFTDKVVEMTESIEEAVVSKAARVKEEVVVRKEATERTETVRDTVRREDVEITKEPGVERSTSMPVLHRLPARQKSKRCHTETRGGSPASATRLGGEIYMSDRVYPGAAPVGATSVETATLLSGGAHIHRRISWAAIFGGVILVVVVQLLLSTLGAGIGLGTVNMNAGTTPDAGNLGMGAGIWWVISSCLALFCGGYVAAWLRRY